MEIRPRGRTQLNQSENTDFLSKIVGLKVYTNHTKRQLTDIIQELKAEHQ